MVDAEAQAAADEREVWRWRREVERERFRWARVDPCLICGEWVGHFGGSIDRDPCSLIPLGLAIEEVRPNCWIVAGRHWIGDAIRAVCDARGVR